MPVAKMVRNLRRAQEIVTVFLRHGFGDVVERMGLGQYLKMGPQPEAVATGETARLNSTAKRFREALEELGGAFVKLGQVLSTRPDILPPRWIEELAHLQDEVAPVDFELIRVTLEAEVGPISESFLVVDPMPLATASVAQVHSGVTRNGEKVVIKVRKPEIKEIILKDCDILEAVAELLERSVPESRNYRPVQIVTEFRSAVKEELDFTQEGRNLERFRADFESEPDVLFPAVHWDRTTERVLTMELMDGIKISLKDALQEQGVDTKLMAERLAHAILRQVLEFGFFHGDPHPGNLMVVDREKICFLDCGMVGRLDEALRENLALLVSAGIRRDTAGIADILTDMTALPEDIDRRRFLKESNLLLDRYYRIPLKRLRLDELINDLMGLVHRFGISVPPDMLLVGKALITLEGVGRTLDPDFEAVAVAAPYVRQIVVTTYWPRMMTRRFSEGAQDVLRLLKDLPSDLRALARHMRENRFQIVIEHVGLKEPVTELARSSRRLSVSLIISALVLGSAITATAPLEPRLLGLPIVSLAGFSVAAALGLWLIIVWYIERNG